MAGTKNIKLIGQEYTDTKNVIIIGRSLPEINNGNPGNLPTPTGPCQILMSLNGTDWTPITPLTSCSGWIVNNCGELLVIG